MSHDERIPPRRQLARFLVTHGLIRDADPSIHTLTGFDREEISASNGATFVHPDDRNDYLAALNDAKSGTSRKLRLRVIDIVRRTTDCRVEIVPQHNHADSVEVLFHWNASRAHTATPSPPIRSVPPLSLEVDDLPPWNSLIGQQRLDQLNIEAFSGAPEEDASVFLIDEHWRITRAYATEPWSGLISGRSIWELVQTLPTNFQLALEQAMRDREVTSATFYLSTLQRSFTAHVIPVEPALALLVRDTTAEEIGRLAAQHDARRAGFLGLLTDAARDPLVSMTLSGSVTFWNAAAERTFGYTRDEAIGTNIYNVLRFSSGNFPDVTTFLRLEHWEGEVGILTRDGRLLTLSARAQLMDPQLGAESHIAVLYTDITALRQVAQRQRQQDRLENLAMLASGVTHDLNSVFTPILLASQLLLQQHDLGADQAVLLKAIESSAARGAAMVSKVLAVARGEASDRDVIPVIDLLTDVVRYCADTIPGHIQFALDRPDRLPAVAADPGQILQVLVNLVDNAKQAIAEAGTITMEITVEDDADLIHIAVHDTGSGIDKATIPRLFEPFFTTKGTAWGTGLGLAASRTIIEHHGGQLDVVSTPGQGSTFTVSLRTAPLSTTSNRDSVPPSFSVQQCEQAVVLIGDPDPHMLATSRATLEDAGYDVVVARDVRAVERWLDTLNRVDLVILATTLDIAQTKKRTAPSGSLQLFVGTAPLRRWTDPGAAMLTKPFSRQDLLAAVERALSSSTRD